MREAANLQQADNHTHLHFSIRFLNFQDVISKIFLLLVQIMPQNLSRKLDPFRVNKPHLQGKKKSIGKKRTVKKIPKTPKSGRRYIPNEQNMLLANRATRQANNCQVQPFPNQCNRLQILNSVHKPLASTDVDQEFHGTLLVPVAEHNHRNVVKILIFRQG